MSGEKMNASRTRPRGLLGGAGGFGADTGPRNRPNMMNGGMSDSMGGSPTTPAGLGSTPGYKPPKTPHEGFGMSDYGNGYSTFKDNATGKGLSASDVVRSTLIDNAPVMNQQTITGSGITSSQGAPINFLGLDGADISTAIRRSPELGAGYATLFGTGLEQNRNIGRGPNNDNNGHYEPWRDVGSARRPDNGPRSPNVPDLPGIPASTGVGSTPTTYSNYGQMTNAELRAANADLQGQNGWLDSNPGTGNYAAGLGAKMPDRADFGNNNAYLQAQLAWQQKRENRFGDANQESWNLQPGTPEWAAYRAKMGLPG